MRRVRVGALSLLALLVVLPGCDDDDPLDLGPFTLDFSGDATFQGAHAGQTVRVAVVSDGVVVAEDEGTVASSGSASFFFTFPDLLELGEDYEVHYWIDSNFSGGAADVCDGPTVDHQWPVDLGTASADEAHVETHRPQETMSVCATFAADLVFQGDAGFQIPHGGQNVEVAVVRSSDGAVLVRGSDVVSSQEDPSFSVSLPGSLMLGESFQVHYWIDSNFGGGTVGTCDPPVNDHQWSVDLGMPDAPTVTFTDSHRPTETSGVCDSFQ